MAISGSTRACLSAWLALVTSGASSGALASPLDRTGSRLPPSPAPTQPQPNQQPAWSPPPLNLPGTTTAEKLANLERWVQGQPPVSTAGNLPTVLMGDPKAADSTELVIPAAGPQSDRVLVLGVGLEIGAWLRKGATADQVAQQLADLKGEAAKSQWSSARPVQLVAMTPDSIAAAEKKYAAAAGWMEKTTTAGDIVFVRVQGGGWNVAMGIMGVINGLTAPTPPPPDPGRAIIDAYRNGPRISEDSFARLAAQAGSNGDNNRGASTLEASQDQTLTDERLATLTEQLRKARAASPDDAIVQWQLGVALAAGRTARVSGFEMVAAACLQNAALFGKPLEQALPGISESQARSIADNALMRAQMMRRASDYVAAAALNASVGRAQASLKALDRAADAGLDVGKAAQLRAKIGSNPSQSAGSIAP